MNVVLKRIKKLAKAVLKEDFYNFIIVPRHWAESIIANVRFGFPATSMRVIGVTGTNGKTTTANIIASVFSAAGHKVGLISTAGLAFGGKIRENDTQLTTAGGWIIQRQLAKMRAKGCDVVVLEVSSHALAQGRALGIPFAVGVMTNLTQEHLDYHHTMQAYAAAKARLFKRARDLSVLNIDDAYFNTFQQAANAQVQTYGTADLADTRLVKTSLKPDGAIFAVESHEQQATFHINQVGLFNVYNAMAAITVARFYDISDQTIQTGLLNLKSVPGRMEPIDEGQPFGVVVDHAHAPDSFQNLLKALRPATKGKLWVVFGVTAARDEAIRPEMGKVAAQQADNIILTDDEPHTEDPAAIRQAVQEGIVKALGQAKTKEIPDRRQAIAEALTHAKAGDIVVVSGLGNQPYRVIGEEKTPWDERQVVREELKKLK